MFGKRKAEIRPTSEISPQERFMARWQEKIGKLSSNDEKQTVLTEEIRRLSAIIAQKPTRNFMSDFENDSKFYEDLNKDQAAERAWAERALLGQLLAQYIV